MSGTSGKSGSARKSTARGAAGAAGAAQQDPQAAAQESGDTQASAERSTTDPAKIPSPPEHIVEAAKQAPDHWFGMIDPTWSGQGVPPEWAMVGQWRSDLEGAIVEWRDNEDYRPSPKALDWPDPTDPVDAAVQLAATGYGPAEDVTGALALAEVAAFVAPDGGLLSAVAPDDRTPVVPVFTSPDHLQEAGRLSFRAMKADELLDQLPEGHVIYLNAAGAVSMTVDPEVLRESMESAQAAESENGWLGDLDGLLDTDPQADPQPEQGGGAGKATGTRKSDGSRGVTDVSTGDVL